MDENKNCVHIDYASFVKKSRTPQEICTEMGLGHLNFIKSRSGPSKEYKTGLSFGGITINHHGLDQEGVLVSLSGEGCETFERESPIGWEALREIATASDAYTTRLDIAYDDFSGTLNLTEIKEMRDKDRYTSHLRRNQETRTGRRIEDGLTVSFGSPKSNVYIRFYDKAAEQKLQGIHWVRAEIQLRGKHAHNAMRQDLPIDVLFAAIMVKYILFKKASKTDSNRSRWPLAPFLESLVAKAQPICLTRPLEPRSDKLKNRIENFKNITRRLAQIIGWNCVFSLLRETANAESEVPYHWVQEDVGPQLVFFGCSSFTPVKWYGFDDNSHAEFSSSASPSELHSAAPQG